MQAPGVPFEVVCGPEDAGEVPRLERTLLTAASSLAWPPRVRKPWH